ncbi:hypothetical protein DFH07DRAFT_953059 [Mycena maculata]|uniref:Uncharacterized protein n=1 Tax=Mycena maculata TaxID=230809 RepID=A0AAD7JVM1_9AGAR|nr:hypothetical protein DFH07DRAFT_953059 [Mycena maculata]
MHSSIHSLAHRAPPATRSRVRWQPYNALASVSTSSRSPSITQLSTPATSVSPSPPPKATPLCEPERLRAQSSMPQTPRDPSNPARDPSKNKYATGLVDQAVKSLCEIWCPQDIPTVFLTSSRATVGSCEIPPPPQSRRRNTQLSSPVSPFTQPSPPSPVSSASPACSRAGSTILQSDQDLASSFGSRSNLVPIKGFVHEVLRRSRTSGSVLQTALCYLEAIRPKVPELIQKEQSGEGARGEPDADFRVMPATAAELEMEAQWAELSATTNSDFEAGTRNDEDAMDTVRVTDEDIACTATPSTTTAASESETTDTLLNNKSASNVLAPLTPLPSPLLCPRRAFLASLILASKFTQDKCYSNRAWAKLSGLPAREIGRCERALGDALDWRLWVGKTPVASQAPSPTTPTPATVGTSRPVVRCQSEGSLAFGKGPFLARNNDKKECANATAASSPPTTRRTLRGLRRSSTLPAEAFVTKEASATKEHGCEPYPAATGGSQFESTWPGEGHQLSLSNIAQQDQLMGSPEFSETSPSTPSSSYSSQQFPSPIPSTPSLSYSPSSTESSSGERTIQMSSFMEDTMAPLSNDVVVVSGCNEMATQWGAPSSPTLSGIAFEAALGYLAQAAYATSEFLAGPSGKFAPSAGHVDTWPWTDSPDECATAPNPAGLGVGSTGRSAKFASAKFARMPALPACLGPDAALDRPYHAYPSHLH